MRVSHRLVASSRLTTKMLDLDTDSEPEEQQEEYSQQQEQQEYYSQLQELQSSALFQSLAADVPTLDELTVAIHVLEYSSECTEVSPKGLT